MSEEIYAPPSFQFYYSDFMGGTADLDHSEIGAYIMLLCYAWRNGSIPNDIHRLAKIVRTSPETMAELWEGLGRHWARIPGDDDHLGNPRLESIRAKAKAFSESNRERGLFGAKVRWGEKDSPAIAQPKPGYSPSIALLSPVSCSASTLRYEAGVSQNETPGPATPKKTTTKRAPKLPLESEAFEARKALVAAIWDRLALTPYSATISRTEWGKRNARVAADLVASGITPEQALAAWDSATERLGEPVRRLAIVQDELGRQAMPKKKEPAQVISAPYHRPVKLNEKTGEEAPPTEAWERLGRRLGMRR